MDTTAIALFLGMLILVLMATSIVAMRSVKLYANQIRSLNQAHTFAVLRIVEKSEYQRQITSNQNTFLETFEKYTNSKVQLLHFVTSRTSLYAAITLIASAIGGYLFNRSMWPYPHVIVALLAGVMLLGWGIYNHLNYHRLRKLND